MPYADPEKRRACHRMKQGRYRLTEKGREAQRASAARERSRHPDETQARKAVNNAIKTGKMVRAACHCGEIKSEAHHHLGYDREHWLDVVFLCGPHHKEAHRAA